MDDFLRAITDARPTDRQLRWQETAFYAFAHFGVNTFTDREWGAGDESPEIFNPAALDTDQWCEAFRAAGMRGVILTAKHHDGFCLWDTKYTAHSVMRSPCGRDVLAALAKSCEKYALKLGVYLSPWDRHEPRYGQGKAYNDYFCDQLTELLTGYGELFSVWFDGACGEGANGKRQVYDWERYYALIRRYQPGAAITVCGPDARWCGNEAGHCRASEWSVVPACMADNEKISESSQQTDDGAFRRRVPSDTEDLGSRAALRPFDRFIWYPAEVNTSIRPGWFYHAAEDDQVKPLAELQRIYLQSAGGNATFLLNVPPDKNGLIASPDVMRLREMGDWLRGTFSDNLLAGAAFTASTGDADLSRGAWQSEETDVSPWLEMRAPGAITPKYAVLKENIVLGQRVEAFAVEAFVGGDWQPVADGTVIGCQKILPLEHAPAAARWRVRVLSCRLGAGLRAAEMY